ncbi:MAG: RDD family protein, partial [Dermacoccus nishinomiyaensis]
LAGAVRTVLLCLAIPAVVTDSSGRGLHDKLAGTVIVRTR